MHAGALFPAIVCALLVGVARAEIDFTFYEYNSCLGFGARNVTFSQDDTISFAQPIYRALRIFIPEGNTCDYWYTTDPVTAKPINAPAMPPMADGYQCVTVSNENLWSVAFQSVTVYNCTGDGHELP